VGVFERHGDERSLREIRCQCFSALAENASFDPLCRPLPVISFAPLTEG
jgi:hypothetical protein